MGVVLSYNISGHLLRTSRNEYTKSNVRSLGLESILANARPHKADEIGFPVRGTQVTWVRVLFFKSFDYPEASSIPSEFWPVWRVDDL